MALDLRNMDCMKLMAEYPDKYFDLAVVDPPYGIGADSMKYANDGGTKTGAAKRTKFHTNNWDSNIPSKKYFNELFRVSKNQIIWGWNNYVSYLNDCPSYIVWNKKTNGDFADCETAWCSIKRPARVFEYLWNGMLQQNMKNKEDRIHPTQKPVALYKWILENYCKQSIRCGHKHTKEYDYLCDTCKHPFKILDTHLGSMSIAIACHDYGFDLTGSEIDKEYFDAGMKRVSNHVSQLSLLH